MKPTREDSGERSGQTRFRRIEELFRTASSLQGEERERFLRQQCHVESSIIQQVLSMLRADDKPSVGILDRPAFGDGVSLTTISREAAQVAAGTPPEFIGRYRIARVIGVGGMGIVYEAEQDSPRRRVALKVLRQSTGLTSRQRLQRFEQEAQILGRLQHPGIAQILEAGTTDAGDGAQPYFVMELVNGQPLLEYARHRQLSIQDRLELVARVCDAVHYAHQCGVVHRDLKPGNILIVDDASQRTAVASTQRIGAQPKVLDFGVARLTDADMQAITLHTTIGELIGTVPYMSPEQAAGDPSQLDWRSDVYSLGVILYELLTDRLPQEVRNLMVHEAVRAIREDDPTPIGTIHRTLRGDVETIVAKALEKDKTQRYQSAAELAADIQRFLYEQPIVARPASAMYRLRKFARRNRAIVSGVAATFIVLVAGLIGTTSMYVRSETARALSAEQRELAELEARRAMTAEVQAQQRAAELSRVVEFQASQLADIDTEMLGIQLRSGVLEERRRMLERSANDPQYIQHELQELEQAIAGINFTNLALASLDEIVFDRALKVLNQQFTDQPLVKAQLLQSAASTMIELGIVGRAEKPQLAALNIRRDMLGMQHPDTLDSLEGWALLQQRQGNYVDAEDAYRQVLEVRSEVLGFGHPDTVKSLNNLGLLLELRGRLDEAELLLRQAVELNRRMHGGEHPQSLTAISNLASLLASQGKLAEAEELHRHIAEAGRHTLGPDHAKTLTAANNLGWHLNVMGKHEEAEAYLRVAIEGRRRNLGDDHPATLRSINNLGVVLQAQSRFEEAERCYHEAMAGRLRVLGDDHLDTLTSKCSIGVLLAQQGRLNDAEPYLRQSMDGFRRQLGPSHDTTLTSIAYTAKLLLLLGRLEESEELGAEAVAVARESLPSGHWRLGQLLVDHAQTLVALRWYDEAEASLLEAKRILAGTLGPEHLLAARATTMLDDLRASQDGGAEANPPTEASIGD